MSALNPLSVIKADTAVDLYRFLIKRTEEIDIRTLIDFCGSENMKEETIDIILDVFLDLVTNKGIDYRHLRRAYANNALNNIIHQKNINKPSDAYKKYFENLIVIPNTPFGYTGITENVVITSDSCCINCEIELDGREQIKCSKCSLYMCSKCSKDNRCFNCHFNEDTNNVSENINKKLMALNVLTGSNYSYVEARVKLANCKLMCSFCNEKILLVNWKKNCSYQFELYINDDKMLDVCCSYCKHQNRLQYFQEFKKCVFKCHNPQNEFKKKIYEQMKKDIIKQHENSEMPQETNNEYMVLDDTEIQKVV
jgi:hypothetical protein